MVEISFIVPCYNMELYLSECIKSIVNIGIKQENYEIIIIDDGSLDKTKKIMKEYEFIENIELIFFDTSSGYAGRARNIGLKMAKGKFVSFIDPDDKFIESGLYEMYNKYNNEYDIIVSSFELRNPQGKLTDKIILRDKDVDRKKDLWSQVKNICNQRSLFRLEFLLENNILFLENCVSEDLLFLYTCYVKQPKIRTTSKVVLEYLDERKNSVSNTISDKYIETSLITFRSLYKVIKGNLKHEEVSNIMSEHFIGYYLRVRKVINQKQKRTIKKFLKDVKL